MQATALNCCELDDMVKVLLERGADPCKADSRGTSALHLAASAGHVSKCKLLLKASSGRAVTLHTVGGRTPLWSAVQAGHLPVVELLHAEYGADFDITDVEGLTLLHAAAGNERCGLPVLAYLLSSGADVNATVQSGNFKGVSLLMAASYAGRTEAARLLVARGANVDALDEIGRSALHYATFPSNRAEMVAVLLELGVAPDAFGEPARPPLVTAVLQGDVQCAQVLIDGGADLAAPCMCVGKRAVDLTPLRQAIEMHAQQAMATALKSAMLNELQRPVLMIADTPAMVKMLLAAGADAYATDLNGNTTLHGAAAAGYPAPVLCLLINADGKTAAQVAHDKGHTLAESLLNRAAQDVKN
jgi:uncharacterized protein